MKYWFDTEFIEYPYTIDLISIGIVAEDGRELYIEIKDFDERKASEWVRENVIKKLWSHQGWNEDSANWYKQPKHWGGLATKKEAGKEIKRFIGSDTPEFWAYYADYDWVAFCWLMGTMIDLPEGWPMYCRDLKQLVDEQGNPSLPKQVEGEHNALSDAKWARDAYNSISGSEKCRWGLKNFCDGQLWVRSCDESPTTTEPELFCSGCGKEIEEVKE